MLWILPRVYKLLLFLGELYYLLTQLIDETSPICQMRQGHYLYPATSLRRHQQEALETLYKKGLGLKLCADSC